MKAKWALLIPVFLLVICAVGLRFIGINADTRVFFSTNNQNRIALDLFEQRYTQNVNLLIALHAKEGDFFTQNRLNALTQITDDAWTLPYATRVESISNAVHISSDEEGIVISRTADLEDAVDAPSAQNRAASDNLLVGKLVSADGKTAAINVSVNYPLESTKATGEIMRAAKALIAQHITAEHGVEAWYGGRVASSFAFSSASKNDLKTFVVLAFAAFFVVLLLLFRSFSIAGSLFLTAMLSALATMGIAGWLGIKITAATAHVPTVIISLGIASLAHLAVSARRHIQSGHAAPQAVEIALKNNAWPIALTLCATSVGFLSLTSADAPPFRQLGLLVSLGSLLCLIFGLTILPALLRISVGRVNSPPKEISQFVAMTSRTTLKYRKILLISAPIICAALIVGATRISIDDTFSDYFSENYEFKRHADLIEQHLTGLEVIDFDIAANGPNGIYDKEYTDKLEAFEAWISEQPKVVHVSSILEVYKRLNQHLNSGQPSDYFVPSDREALAQYILLYEMSLPLGQDLNNSITIDKSRSRFTTVMRKASTAEVKELKERAEQWLNETPSSDISGPGTGLAVMFAYLSSLNVKSMIGGTAIALLIISSILIIAFRSIRYGAISLVPNLLPGAVAFGVWGYLVGEVGVAVSVVGAMALGIIVDDTIHIICRYREARNDGAAPEEAATYMFDKVGEPMLISTIVLITGFAVLSFSGFVITSSSGILVALTIFFALALDWFFLVPLMVTMDRFLDRHQKHG